jgi:tetratricopeptide (TPR) repeat protein
MESSIEELYLEAEADFKNSAYTEAFRKYETILYEQPDHAPSHNSLGWLYKHQFDDYTKAENHFTTAIKSEPNYPHPYYHYATLLTDQERFADLEKLLKNCLKVAILEKGWVYEKMGIAEEMKLNFEGAIGFYQMAILHSLKDDKIKDYQTDIDRCQLKSALKKEMK